MTDLTMRDARPEDRAAIEDVTIAAYQEYAPIMQERWEIYRHSILGTLADVRPAEQIVAARGATIVGTVLLFPAGTAFKAPGGVDVSLAAPEIRLLAVAPAARGLGVGAALVNECMQVAMRMYERMGYVRAPELDFSPAPEFVIKGYRYTLAAAPQ